MTEDRAPQFRNLKLVDRFKLANAAAVEAFSGVALKDTKHSARFYPLYLAYMAYLVVPFPPIPGSRLVPTLCLYGWVRLGLTERSRRANEEINKRFNHAALVDDHRQFIHADPKSPGQFRVEGGRLTVNAYKTALRDTKEAHRIFTRRVEDFFFS
ncbi:MAG: hypothetical protein ACXW4B_10835 [Micavibrio sp.]